VEQQPRVRLLFFFLFMFPNCPYSDLHKVLDEFYGGCASAGPAGCALAEPTAASVQARVEAIFTSLKTKPIGVDIGNGTLDYGMIDYGTLRILMLSFIASPFGSGFTAPALAEALVGLEHGNGTLLWGGYPSLAGTRQLQCECDGPTQQTEIGFESEMAVVIACTDGAAVHDTVPQLESWYERNAKLTSYADLWPFRVVCAYVCSHFSESSQPLQDPQRVEDSSGAPLHDQDGR
jgi:hypothetical protein